MVNVLFSLYTDASHSFDRFHRIRTLGTLTTQHDGICSVKHGIRHIGCLGTSRTRVHNHTLEHLSSSDDRLAGKIALVDHHLLCAGHTLDRDLNTEITTCHHNSIGDGEDLGKVLETLLVLDLANDLDVGITHTGKVENLLHIRRLSDKRGSNEINTLLHTEGNVFLVLIGDSRQVHLHTREVHALVLVQMTLVQYLALNRGVRGLEHAHGQKTVIDQDDVAHIHHLGEVGVGGGHNVLVAHHGGVAGEDESRADRQQLFGGAVRILLQTTGSDFGALGIQHHSTGAMRTNLERSVQVVNHRLVVGMRTMREVHTNNIHASIQQFTQHFD
mmetsp:Transcript_11559/g.35348  ORF Transcript_11559/g.35348 Transcript_11559/m.35348 type:complete len:330 (+) Transcript_11559:369-1358(+)